MIRIAIVGTGWWAGVHASEFARDERAQVVAVCGSSLEKARAFAEEHAIGRAYGDFDKLLSDGEIDAVAIVSPDATHCAFALAALKAGLHVLCEKPLAMSVEEAQQMAEAAALARRVNMVNLSYRKSAALENAVKLVQGGSLGRIYHAEARYMQNWLVAKDQGDWQTERKWLWRLSSAHGSKGALGDTGVHILDFATLPLGPVKDVHCRLKTFDKAPGGRIGEYVLDVNDTALIDMEMESGALLSVQVTRLACGRPNQVGLSIYGERGALEIDLDKGWDELRLARLDNEGKQLPWETLRFNERDSIYRRFVSAIESGRMEEEPNFARGLELQALLAACEASNAQSHWGEL